MSYTTETAPNDAWNFSLLGPSGEEELRTIIEANPEDPQSVISGLRLVMQGLPNANIVNILCPLDERSGRDSAATTIANVLLRVGLGFMPENFKNTKVPEGLVIVEDRPLPTPETLRAEQPQLFTLAAAVGFVTAVTKERGTGFVVGYGDLTTRTGYTATLAHAEFSNPGASGVLTVPAASLPGERAPVRPEQMPKDGPRI